MVHGFSFELDLYSSFAVASNVGMGGDELMTDKTMAIF
jgi:hypothetical protein